MSNTKDQQEPSMEDILASIRRILSEDEVEEPPSTKPAAAAAPAAESQPEPEEEDVLELDESMVMVEAPSTPAEADDASDLDDQSSAGEGDLEEMREQETAQEVRPMFAAAPMQVASEMEPEVESLVTPAAAEASTAALSELARAVARERGVGLGTRGITLEDMVRDIMRPMLKDWLDQNLPFMVERIVRQEIERMVNRAERP